MTTLYRYSFDKRLVAFWGAFGARPAKDGVTPTDDARLRASFGFLKLELHQSRRGRSVSALVEGFAE